MIDPPDVHTVATTLMGAIVQSAIDMSVPIPDRHVLSAGGAVYDCEMVSVTALGVTVGLPGSVGASSLVPCGPEAWSVQAEMAIIRDSCEVPQGPRGELPPSPAAIEGELVAASADVAVLIEASLKYAGSARAATSSISLGQTQGGMRAVVATISVPLWPSMVV